MQQQLGDALQGFWKDSLAQMAWHKKNSRKPETIEKNSKNTKKLLKAIGFQQKNFLLFCPVLTKHWAFFPA